jgi:hypothetical protein
VVEHLRTLVLAEWEQFKQCAGDGDSSPKDRLRQKYRANRLEILRRDRSWIAFNACKLLDWFASGSEVVPEKIAPRLVRVETEAQQALFRLARYTWSLPWIDDNILSQCDNFVTLRLTFEQDVKDLVKASGGAFSGYESDIQSVERGQGVVAFDEPRKIQPVQFFSWTQERAKTRLSAEMERLMHRGETRR